jgi:hypothetical protein
MGVDPGRGRPGEGPPRAAGGPAGASAGRRLLWQGDRAAAGADPRGPACLARGSEGRKGPPRGSSKRGRPPRSPAAPRGLGRSRAILGTTGGSLGDRAGTSIPRNIFDRDIRYFRSRCGDRGARRSPGPGDRRGMGPVERARSPRRRRRPASSLSTAPQRLARPPRHPLGAPALQAEPPRRPAPRSRTCSSGLRPRASGLGPRLAAPPLPGVSRAAAVGALPPSCAPGPRRAARGPGVPGPVGRPCWIPRGRPARGPRLAGRPRGRPHPSPPSLERRS